jgi:tetratricopeptide (TPR) repeat protein
MCFRHNLSKSTLMPFPYKVLRLVAFLFCSGLSFFSYGQGGEMGCGSLEFGYGPYDYRSSKEKLAVVERFHFTPKVENLLGGENQVTAGADLAYTLAASPNHHRALMAVMKLAEKEKRVKPLHMPYSVDCYFERAERFRPDDSMVKTIHGIYLIRSRKLQAGTEKLESALSQAGENANIYYNLGLAYFDLKQFDKSLESAHRAYALSFPLPGLRDKLKRAGKWSEPIPVAVNLPKKPEIPAKEESLGNPTLEAAVPSPEPAVVPSGAAN